MSRPEMMFFASGTPTGGGSGVRVLLDKIVSGWMDVDVRLIVSNNPNGGVWQVAEGFAIPFQCMDPPYDAEHYQRIYDASGAEFVSCSGWLKKVYGLPPEKTDNIHPGLLVTTDEDRRLHNGGPGHYGHHVHENAIRMYRAGLTEHSAVCMHFVTTGPDEENPYDSGPLILRKLVPILPDDTAETLAKRVNDLEHMWQWQIIRAKCHGLIRWDGQGPRSIIVPDWVPIESLPRAT